MASNSEYQTYYVPARSKLPLFASIALFLTVFGIANWLNGNEGGQFLTLLGLISMLAVLWNWFSQVISENQRGLNSDQLKTSYVWAMGWFIFSEVMFFAAFFGALFYIRQIALPGIEHGATGEVLWNGFEAEWPLMTTPDMAVNGESAEKFVGPDQNMSNPGVGGWVSWLPFWNTVLLLASSVTVHFAHTELKKDKNGRSFNIWLAVTVSLGLLFLVLQAEEYIHAYHHMGLTLDSGVYGTTFFMLTGFHGAHVTLGTIMLLVQLLRSTDSWLWRAIPVVALIIAEIAAFSVDHMSLAGRMVIVGIACLVIIAVSAMKPSKVFKHHDCFGFEASSWYWHFVDVVWLGLFIFVYILG